MIATTGNTSSEIKDDSMKYDAQEGGNNAPATFQEASGALVEQQSSLGYSVSAFTILFLNIGAMVGTGIFSTRK